MITKKYGDIEVNYEINFPDEFWEKFVIDQNKDLNIFDCGLPELEYLQKMPKFFPGHHIGEYCLYLGSYTSKGHGAFGAKKYVYDLYAHRQFTCGDYYGTGIVFGPEGSDYYSGWPMSLNNKRFDIYHELFYREYACNLITPQTAKLFLEASFINKFNKVFRYE